MIDTGTVDTPGHRQPRAGCVHRRCGSLPLSLVLLSLTLPAQAFAQAKVPIPSSAELEARGAIIGRIRFEAQDIFNENDPRENNAVYRLANELHIKTRESALRAQLLFKEGDRYSWHAIRETERNMRQADYLFDADITVASYDGQQVEIVVATRDVWSLQPGISYSRKGGENASGFEIQEENLLGYGKSLSIGRSRDPQRTSTSVDWRDPNVWGTRWRDGLSYASSDDGHLRAIDFEHPFFSLDTRWSARLTAIDNRRVDPRYDLGEVVDEYRRDVSFADLQGGISAGLKDGWTRRWVGGFRYDRQMFAVAPDRLAPIELPPDRTLSYPWLGVHWIEDEYVETQNLNQIGRTEDLYYGTSYRLELGYAAESLGSTRDAAIVAAAAGTAFKISEAQSLFLTTGAIGRYESGDLRNGLINGRARYYWRWNPKRVLYASLDATATDDLDPENQLLMGGETDLRGYPLAYQAGTSRVQFTVEQRIYTDWFPFRLFNVGGAAFFDAGRIYGRGIAGTPSLGWLTDVGVGLRLGNARSGFGSVIHIDVAYALNTGPGVDRVQFIVDTKRSF